MADDIYVQRDNNMLRGTKECLIKSFAFYYNHAYRIYKDAKYGVSYQLQELAPIEYRGTNELVRRLDIKDNKFNIGETFHDNKVIRAVYQEHVAIGDIILEVEDNSTTEQGTLVGIKTPLDIISIALRDIRKVKQRTTLVLNKGKRL